MAKIARSLAKGGKIGGASKGKSKGEEMSDLEAAMSAVKVNRAGDEGSTAVADEDDGELDLR